jgi:hypothetical protein
MNVTSANNLVYNEYLIGAGYTDPIKNIPTDISVACIPGTESSAKVQYTLDSTLDEANWKDWPKGTVAEYTEDVLVANVYALRLAVLFGEASIRLVGKRYV